MPTFVMLIKISSELAKNPASMEEIGNRLGARCQAACPEMKITTHLGLLGPYDFLEILEAPSAEMAFRTASLIMASGMASSVETWTALPFTYPKMLELMIGI